MMARMGWGMKDPAAEARRRLERQGDVGVEWERSRGSTAARDGLLVLLFVALAAGAIWWTVQREDAAAVRDPLTRLARTPVTGLSGESLARPVNLEPVLTEMAQVAGADDLLVSLRVAPHWVQATMLTPDGEQYFLDRRVGGRVERRTFARTSRTAHARLGDIDPAVPKRAIASAGRQAGPPADALDYLVLNWPDAGDPSVFLRFDADRAADTDWVGTGDGSQMRRANPAAPGASSVVTTRTTVRVTGADDDPLRIARCLQDAGGDPQKVLECVR